MKQRIRAIAQGEYGGKKNEEENKDRFGDMEECRANCETGRERRENVKEWTLKKGNEAEKAEGK